MSFASGMLARLRSRVAAVIGRYRFGFAAIDQIALSLFGFALNLCLIRSLSATDYGIVTLWMAIALLAIGVQDALVNTPLSIHVAAAPDPARAARLEAALAIVNWLVIGLATALVVLVNHVSDAEWSPHDLLTVAAIPLFVAAGMYREYHRSIAYSRNDMAMLLRIDGPYLAVTTLLLVAMLVWPARLANLAVAFLAMSAGCLVTGLRASAALGAKGRNPFRRGWLRDYREIARDAAWALLGVVTTHLHARSYVYVTVNLVGLASLAAINVVGLMFRPIRIMVTAWGRTALPTMAADLAAGRVGAVDRALVRASAVALAGSAVWILLLWLGWDAIDRHFLVGQYPDAWLLVWPWAIASGLDAVSHIGSIALRAAREFKFLAFSMMATAPITLGATAVAVLWHGYVATMYGVAFGQLIVLTIGTCRLYWVRQRVIAQAAAEPGASRG